ncbi:hypothetical protein EDB86DRAFT_1181058 [Lactarius hatsudake]|nr:hypothetical protein EDB86DRAFT_1181058 [Lactarius hatsudake]
MPCGHSWPARQAGRLYPIRQRGLLTTEDAETFAAAARADVDLLLSSADESRAFLPPDRTASTTGTRNTGDDAESVSTLLQHNTALQKELAVRCGGTRSTFPGALEADQGALRAAEEEVGTNLKVAKQVRVRVHDHRGKSLGTTCLNDIERRRRRDCVFCHVFCHSVHMRGSGRWPPAS